jgi:hypothetical protein
MQLISRIRYRLAAVLFPAWERFGLHVTPDHYYHPIPSSRDLTDAVFERRSDMVGVAWNEREQLRHLSDIFPTYVPEETFAENSGLSPVDAAILHAMIRYYRPAKIVEVGSGESTKFSGRACVRNRQDGTTSGLTAIEPYPRDDLASTPGLDCLIQKKVQDVELVEFSACDLLFIDSSHVVKMGGDVNYLFLEVIPRLKPGCLVHVHDILLPGEYWRDWVLGRRLYWTEQYLLHAFLLFNSEFEILWASRFMQMHHEEAIVQQFPFYSANHRITSFWIRRRPGI